MDSIIHRVLIKQGYSYGLKYSDGNHGYKNHDNSKWLVANPNTNMISIFDKVSTINCSYYEYINKLRLVKIKKIKANINDV